MTWESSWRVIIDPWLGPSAHSPRQRHTTAAGAGPLWTRPLGDDLFSGTGNTTATPYPASRSAFGFQTSGVSTSKIGSWLKPGQSNQHVRTSRCSNSYAMRGVIARPRGRTSVTRDRLACQDPASLRRSPGPAVSGSEAAGRTFFTPGIGVIWPCFPCRATSKESEGATMYLRVTRGRVDLAKSNESIRLVPAIITSIQ